ncbi:class C beta-lactamase [Cupriavidus sp. P-10]|uniref:class C beta-lactamase n=1 Tax=Cupriavidus sp. P-10 TaxID=2027911 RepID=UPI000E2F1B02|nr:class C beta-lactamase [Cupriavidus sp. P-10]BDB27200.1 class C beta-lactamase [Cupriavidus sp. P-10]
MKIHALTRLAAIAATGLLCTPAAYAADKVDPRQLERAVNEAIAPMMKAHNIPGMAIAVTAGGKQYFFNYGVTAKRGGKPVTESTLFEIGSVSKTFTATLAGYAQARGAMSLSDPAGKYLPALAGSALGTTSLLDLGTYAAGGLPLQFPEAVNNPQAMVDYFRAWQPAYAAGTHRRYSNPSIGLFGYLAARSLGEPFDDLMEKTLFPAFGLKRTYIRVPKPLMADYAWGYTKDDKPTRVTPGVLDSEAYGVKTTSADMIRFVEANLSPAGLDDKMQRAIATARTGYFKVGSMVQGLGWEMYAYPTPVSAILAGSSPQVVFEANKVDRLEPPQAQSADVLVNKTGSTNGFGAYVVFVPAKRIGLVMLGNKNMPVPARVEAAYHILTVLDAALAAKR